MAIRVDVQARNIKLTDRIVKHVEQRAGKLDRYLAQIEEADVELTHHQSARNAGDRNVAQITVRGKGLILRTEERSDEVLTAFDSAIEKLQRQIDRYKGKHYRGRGDGQSLDAAMEEAVPADQTDRPLPIIARRKQFRILPMDEYEAIEQMNLLGHEDFFIFYNGETSRVLSLIHI